MSSLQSMDLLDAISAKCISIILHRSLWGETEWQQGDSMTDSPPHTHLRTPLLEDMVRQPSVNILMDGHMLFSCGHIEKST